MIKLTAFTLLSVTLLLIKLKNNCSMIRSNQDIDEIKFLREGLKNKNTIMNNLLENIFSNKKHFFLTKTCKIIIK